MEFIHQTVTGTHLLHWLTVAVPVATLVVVSGVVHRRTAARLLLVGVAMTLATAALASTALTQVRYGAPLPLLRVGLDPLGGDMQASVTLLRACFVANLLFWCSSAVLLGGFIQALARRLRPSYPARA